MADVEVKNKDNKKVDSISLSDDVFGLPVKASLMHENRWLITLPTRGRGPMQRRRAAWCVAGGQSPLSRKEPAVPVRDQAVRRS